MIAAPYVRGAYAAGKCFVMTLPASGGQPKPLGTQTFHLLDAMAYAPDDHQGQKMYVRGLLIRLPGEQRVRHLERSEHVPGGA